MRYPHFEMLPEDGFQHCGNRKIQLHNDYNPVHWVEDTVEALGSGFEDVIGSVGDALSGLDDFVREEIPGGWLLPAAAVAAVATGGTSLAALGEAGAAEGAAAGAASSSTLAMQTAITQSLVDIGIPFNTAVNLTSASTLATNAAINAATQVLMTGKVDPEALMRSLATGAVSSVAGGVVSDAIDNKLLASIANSAAQGATGALVAGKNPVTSALASALAGGVGYSVRDSGISQSAVTSAVRTLASGQSIQNALVSAAVGAGGSFLRPYIKDAFEQISPDKKAEAGEAFDKSVEAQVKVTKYIDDNRENIKQIQLDQSALADESNKEKIDNFNSLRDDYDSHVKAYESNKELATNTAAYETEMRNRGYEQFLTGEGDPIYGPNGWAQRTGGHWVTYYDEDNQPHQEYAPDYADEDSNSIRYIPAPSQQDFVKAANEEVRQANSIGEQLSLAVNGGIDDIDRNALQSTISQQQEIYGSNYDQYRSLTNAANNFGGYLSSLGYAQYGEDGWAKLAPNGESFEYGGDDESRHPIWYSGPSQSDLYNQANEYKQKADAAQSVISDATAKLKNADFIDKYGVKDVIAAHDRLVTNAEKFNAGYDPLFSELTNAQTKFNSIIPNDKLANYFVNYLTGDADQTTGQSTTNVVDQGVTQATDQTASNAVTGPVADASSPSGYYASGTTTPVNADGSVWVPTFTDNTGTNVAANTGNVTADVTANNYGAFKGLDLQSGESIAGFKYDDTSDPGHPQYNVTIKKDNPDDPNNPYVYSAIYDASDLSKPAIYEYSTTGADGVLTTVNAQTKPVFGEAKTGGSGEVTGNVTGSVTGGSDSGVTGGVTGGVTDGVTEGVKDGVAGGVKDGVTQGVTENVTDGTTGGVKDGVTNGVTNGVTGGIEGGSPTGSGTTGSVNNGAIDTGNQAANDVTNTASVNNQTATSGGNAGSAGGNNAGTITGSDAGVVGGSGNVVAAGGSGNNSDINSQLSKAIEDVRAEGLTGNNALRAAIEKVASDNKTTSEGLLNLIGSSTDQLRSDFSSKLQSATTGIDARIDALVQSGINFNVAMKQAIAESQQQTSGAITDLGNRFNNRIDELVTQGVKYQDATNQALKELGSSISDTEKTLLEKIASDKEAADKAAADKAAADARILLDKERERRALAAQTGYELVMPSAAALASTPQTAPTFKSPFMSSPIMKSGEFAGPLTAFLKQVQKGDYTQDPYAQQQEEPVKQTQEPQMSSSYFNYGQDNNIDQILGQSSNVDPMYKTELLTAKKGGLATPLMAGGGTTRYGRYAGGGLNVVNHEGKDRIDFRTGNAVTGPGDGQSDDIPAMLADGEFVFPADVVAALGNGSTKAGSDKLYEMMHSIRSHARSAGPKDLPPPAKSPLDYLKKSRKARR